MNYQKNTKEQIYHTAHRLFTQYGWKKITVEHICEEAGLSKVTFYKYFKNKKDILIRLFLDCKNETKQAFMAILEEKHTSESALAQLFNIQKNILKSLYSPAILYDINHNKDKELMQFFNALEEEKYEFLNYFFLSLQKKKIINPNLPIAFINCFIRSMDQMMQAPEIITLYENDNQQLPKDILQVLVHGIAYPKK